MTQKNAEFRPYVVEYMDSTGGTYMSAPIMASTYRSAWSSLVSHQFAKTGLMPVRLLRIWEYTEKKQSYPYQEESNGEAE